MQTIRTNDGEADIGAHTFSNNLMYKSGVADVVSWKGTGYTVAEWNDSTPAGVTAANNIGGDPLFADASTDKFWLKPGSPGRNAAECIAAYVDKLQQTTTFGVDSNELIIKDCLSIGAYGVYRGAAGM